MTFTGKITRSAAAAKEYLVKPSQLSPLRHQHPISRSNNCELRPTKQISTDSVSKMPSFNIRQDEPIVGNRIWHSEGQKTDGNEQASKRDELGKLDEWPQINVNEPMEMDQEGRTKLKELKGGKLTKSNRPSTARNDSESRPG
ncbi:hypothetical protein M514_08467 [Trichuris suis]|uniref:Uncharacterized protein n=2 Tax=Trichuris suis TaxID=68888 RepID=A0A085MV95_9BILA|nr:hypothetical protein M514_08467 [Trichuris suis]